MTSPSYVYAVQSGITSLPLDLPVLSMVEVTCPKCGTTKKSGKLSCCARGGAWFKKCGDGGDTKFEHTWTEGIQACKSKWLRDCLLAENEI